MHALLHPYAELIRFLFFAGFVLLGVAVILLRRRALIHLLIAYTLAVNVLLVIARNEAWPFSRYPMMAVPTVDPNAANSMLSFRAVDGDGREWKIDPLAWSPLFPAAVMGWVVNKMPVLPAPERREALLFLLQRAEASRAAAWQRSRFGNEALLGPLTAPDVFYYGPRPAPAPTRFVALRIYRMYWLPMTGREVRRDLIAEQRL